MGIFEDTEGETNKGSREVMLSFKASLGRGCCEAYLGLGVATLGNVVNASDLSVEMYLCLPCCCCFQQRF